MLLHYSKQNSFPPLLLHIYMQIFHAIIKLHDRFVLTIELKLNGSTSCYGLGVTGSNPDILPHTVQYLITCNISQGGEQGVKDPRGITILYLFFTKFLLFFL